MANVQYYDVILKPVVTEKTMELMGDKKYTFLVHPEATKSQIKEAVEKMFDGTKVAKVNTMNCEGKKKRVRGTFKYGKTAATKKAIPPRRLRWRSNIERRKDGNCNSKRYLLNNSINCNKPYYHKGIFEYYAR